MPKILLSFFDYTENWCKPYKEDINWIVYPYDIKKGKDIMDFNPAQFMSEYLHSDLKYTLPEIGLLFTIPCTCYANCGARHHESRIADGQFEQSQKLVEKVKEIIDWFEKAELLKFWVVENPMSRIHKFNLWLGNVKHKFNPCDYAGYDPTPNNSRYNKMTWLWGNFNIPEKKYLDPLEKDNPGWKNLGGKSERTKELRSITPMGFANAFYEKNN